MKRISTREELEQWLKDNKEKESYIFKRSTRCPVSFSAFEHFKRFAAENPHIPMAYLDVIESRAASNHLAETTGIKHQSPQVLHFQEGSVVWHDSHHNITHEKLTQRKKTS